jgi:hypothetical protein
MRVSVFQCRDPFENAMGDASVRVGFCGVRGTIAARGSAARYCFQMLNSYRVPAQLNINCNPTSCSGLILALLDRTGNGQTE